MKSFSLRQRGTLAVLSVLLILGTVSSAFAQVVDLPDPVLQWFIRSSLRKLEGDITREDMLRLTNLYAAGGTSGIGGTIRSLEGLGAATNLNSLDLGFNGLERLQIPQGLINLSTLNLRDNPLMDLTLSEELTRLTTLTLAGDHGLTNFSFLGKVPSLATLTLVGGNLNTNFSFLRQVPSLTTLILNLPVGSMSPTFPEGLTNITTIRMRGLTNFALLSEMSHLTTLDLSGNFLRNFTLPDGLSNLVVLELGNPLTNLTLPSGLNRLTTLGLSRSRFKSFILPDGLTNLTTLDLRYSPSLTNLTLPSGLNRLTTLQLDESGNLENLSILGTLPALMTLDLGFLFSLRDLSFLSAMPNLTMLSLQYAGSEPKLPQGLTSLTTLTLTNTIVTDFSFLSRLPNLTTLNLPGELIETLTLPGGLNRLTTLNLQGQNRLRRMTVPAGITNFLPPLEELIGRMKVEIKWLPSIRSADRKANGDFSLKYMSDVGRFRVLRSTDLKNWFHVGSLEILIPNYTGTIFTDTNVLGEGTAFYQVVEMPSFERQPESITTFDGFNVVFSAVGRGAGVLSYQWFQNGVPIVTATNANLALTRVNSANVGSYHVVITGPLESLSSKTVSLTVRGFPANGIVVSNSFSSGPGSFRQAIIDANNAPGTNVILFQIKSAIPVSIKPSPSLPPITDAVVIDGTTQPSTGGMSIVELRGPPQASLGASGLILQAPSIIRGLAINGWPGNGIELEGSGEHVIQGNYIGIDSTGKQAVPNGSAGILITGGSACLIGGTNAFDRNVISGNGRSGIELTAGASENRIFGNFIGTDASGTSPIPNGGAGVLISSASHNRVGGELPGEGNLISGNQQSGVNLNVNLSLNPPIGTEGNWIQGNQIGLNLEGNSARPNNGSGILISGDCSNTLIGGTNASAGNTISGNQFSGIEIAGGASDTLVIGNRIGTDVSGTTKVPNVLDGVLLSGNGSGFFPIRTTIGTTNAGGGNIISGNSYSGIEITGRGTGTRIAGNFIGTDVHGQLSLGNFFAGIFLSQDASGNAANTQPVSIVGNTIAYNLEAGVDVQDRRSPSNPYNTSISIRQNSIFANHLMGIDLQPTGRTANDAGDADAGANGQQNHPVIINAVVAVDGKATIQGRLNSRPNLVYTIDLYASAQCDPDGSGEAQTWLKSLAVRTDASGNAVFEVVVEGLPEGQTRITATATDPTQSTSEFSQCYEVKQ